MQIKTVIVPFCAKSAAALTTLGADKLIICKAGQFCQLILFQSFDCTSGMDVCFFHFMVAKIDPLFKNVQLWFCQFRILDGRTC